MMDVLRKFAPADHHHQPIASRITEFGADPTLALVISDEQTLTVSGADGRDQFVEDGGDATFLMHKSTELNAAFAKDGTLPDQESTTNPEFKVRFAVGEEFSLTGYYQVDANGKALGKRSLVCGTSDVAMRLRFRIFVGLASSVALTCQLDLSCWLNQCASSCELVHTHGGQSGNQLGTKFWDVRVSGIYASTCFCRPVSC